MVSRIEWWLRVKNVEHKAMAKHYGVYSYMFEPTIINDSCTFRYDFEDFAGFVNWDNMFVNKLINTHKGNCHSLPFLHKILTEAIGAESYLALAPAHVYIKHQDESGKWVNIETTNGGNFATDAWIISSSGITSEAIKNGIYMVPLSRQESVALTLYDLAMRYKEKYGHSTTVS